MSGRATRSLAALLAVPLFLSSAALAEETRNERIVDLFSQGRPVEVALPDLAIPEAPAFAILGVAPQSVLRPATPRLFGAGLLNGFDDNGNFQSGLALDVSPYRMALGERLTIGGYRSSYLTRFLSRAQLSLATAKGLTNDDEAIRMALGLLITPFDLGDPRLDRGLDACFDEVVHFVELAGSPRAGASSDFPPIGGADDIIAADEGAVGAIEEQVKRFVPGIDACREKRAKARWNRASWQIGIAPAWIDQKVRGDDDLESNGFGVWTSLSWGFEDLGWLERGEPAPPPTRAQPDYTSPPNLLSALRETSQLIVHARHLRDQEQLDPNVHDLFFSANTTFVGARFRVGVPKLAFSFDGSWNHLDPKGALVDTDEFYRFSGGGSLRIWEDIWVDATIGGTGGRRLGDETYANVALRFGASQQGLGGLLQTALRQFGPGAP